MIPIFLKHCRLCGNPNLTTILPFHNQSIQGLFKSEKVKIPESKLKKAEHSKNPKTAHRARLAETLKKLRKK